MMVKLQKVKNNPFPLYACLAVGRGEGLKKFVNLPAHRAGLPGRVISFYIVPLDPAYLLTAGRQGGACGARSGQRFSMIAEANLEHLSFFAPFI
jgi:hypothetical protein